MNKRAVLFVGIYETFLVDALTGGGAVTMADITWPNENLIVTGKPIVIVKDALVFRRDGVVVGTIDASYDFSELPDELHELAVGIASNNRHTLYLSVEQDQAGKNPENPKKVDGFFRRIFRLGR